MVNISFLFIFLVDKKNTESKSFSPFTACLIFHINIVTQFYIFNSSVKHPTYNFVLFSHVFYMCKADQNAPASSGVGGARPSHLSPALPAPPPRPAHLTSPLSDPDGQGVGLASTLFSEEVHALRGGEVRSVETMQSVNM